MVFPLIFISNFHGSSPDEEEEINLMDMPDLVMTKILDDVDFKDIIRLRKVCRRLRSSIDHLQPLKLTGLNLDCRPSRINITIATDPDCVGDIHYYYAKYGDHCVINTLDGENPKLIRDSDYMEIFKKDFGSLLRNQQSPMQCVKIQGWTWNGFSIFRTEKTEKPEVSTMTKWTNSVLDYFRSPPLESGDALKNQLEEMNRQDLLPPAADRFYDALAWILKSRREDSPIQMTELYIRVLQPHHFLNMAPYINFSKMDTLIVGRIHLKPFDDRFRDTKITINGISELKNWEKIRHLDVIGFKVSVPICQFLHKSIMELSVPKISVDDILAMKEYLLTASHLKTYTILYDHLEGADRLESALGPFFHHRPTGKHWFFRIPGSHLILFVSQDPYNQGIGFERSVGDYIPKKAIIQ